jgi:hypothetical protein
MRRTRNNNVEKASLICTSGKNYLGALNTKQSRYLLTQSCYGKGDKINRSKDHLNQNSEADNDIA